MTTIDASKGLTQANIKAFGQLVKDDELITVEYDNKKIESVKQNFAESFLSSDMFDNVDEKVIFTIKAPSVEITTDVYNFNWWKKTKKRIEKFHLNLTGSELVESKPNVDTYDDEYSIAIATLVEGKLTNIKHLSANKKDAIKFVNDEIATRYIDSVLKAKLVINLCYEEADNENTEVWFTLDELENMGVITLR